MKFRYEQELWTIKKLQKHIRKTYCEAGYPELKNVAKSNIWEFLNVAEIKPLKFVIAVWNIIWFRYHYSFLLGHDERMENLIPEWKKKILGWD